MLEKFQTKRKKKFLLKAREGDLEFVSKYLTQRPQDVNVTNSIGLSSLQLSSRGGHVSLVSYLLHRGADIDAFTKKGNTALGFASFEGHLKVVQELVKYGANVNFRSNEESYFPLYLACQRGHSDIAQFLLKNGADPDLYIKGGYRPYDVALQEGRIKCLTCLLEHQGVRDRIGPFPIHVAIKNADRDTLRLLLKEGFHVDEQSKLGFTALHYATYFKNIPLVNYCLDEDANVNLQSKVGITALHIASSHGDKDILLILLDRGATPGLCTKDGLTALHCAAKHGRTKETSILLEHGENVQAKTDRGMTALHLAVQGNHVECIKLLLDWKSHIDELNEDGFSPLHIAACFNRIASAKFLLERRCNVNAKKKNGLSTIDVAKKLNNTEITKMLMEHGAKTRHDCNATFKVLPNYEVLSDFRPKTFAESQILNQPCDLRNFTPTNSTLSTKGKSETDVSFDPISSSIYERMTTLSSNAVNDSIPLSPFLQLNETTSDLQSSLATDSISSSIGGIYNNSTKSSNVHLTTEGFKLSQNIEMYNTSTADHTEVHDQLNLNPA